MKNDYLTHDGYGNIILGLLSITVAVIGATFLYMAGFHIGLVVWSMGGMFVAGLGAIPVLAFVTGVCVLHTGVKVVAECWGWRNIGR